MAVESILLQSAAEQITERPEWIWLALGSALMFLGTVYFMVKGAGVEDPEARMFFVVTTLIPAIAFASYISMLFGFGLTRVELVTAPSGLETTLDIYWARYADWLFTTPLLLLDLALLVDADRSTIIGLILADAFMIITGLVGAITTVFAFRFVWWTISTAAPLYILYVLYFGFTAKLDDMSDERAGTFKVLRNIVLVLWSVYPVWWLLGTEGAQVFGLFVETLGFMVLDVSAKVVFGAVLLRSRAIFGEMEAPEPSATGEPTTAD